jgi:hypothetical protein
MLDKESKLFQRSRCTGYGLPNATTTVGDCQLIQHLRAIAAIADEHSIFLTFFADNQSANIGQLFQIVLAQSKTIHLKDRSLKRARNDRLRIILSFG